MEVVPGGRSKETILVTLTGTTELPADVIVRIDRPVGILQTRAADEFAVLQAVYAHGGVPVPRPFFADELDADGARTLLVMERVSGQKAGEYFPDLAAPTEHCHALGEQLAAALAHVHGVPLETLAASSLDVDAAVTEASVTAAVEGMAARIGELGGPPIVAVPLARQWLLDHVADVVPSGPLHLLQGDVGLHNMLVERDRVTALVDWEAATVGPPARELAAARPAATALMRWEEFVDAYRAAGGPPEATDERAVAFYRVFFALGACMSSRTGWPLLPHRSQARSPHGPLGARRPLPRPAQPRPRPGGRPGRIGGQAPTEEGGRRRAATAATVRARSVAIPGRDIISVSSFLVSGLDW